MAQFHDFGAESCGSFILNKIRANDSRFKQVFSPSMVRIGDFEWPRPDYVIQDLDTSATYALEYKPPMQSKREYVCGLGQSLAYLQHHTYSGLIIPKQAEDGFNISEFMLDVFKTKPMIGAPVSLFLYNDDLSSVDILQPIEHEREDFESHRMEGSAKTFWCWWRDMSFSDLFQLLKLSFDYNSFSGDIYSEYIFPQFWNMLVSKECFDFEGKVRNVSSEKSRQSSKQNYRIPLVQLGLCTNLECRLTNLGFKLLSIGLRYGSQSQIFRDSLAYLILTDGKHLDLINFINKFQQVHPVPSKSDDYRLALEASLTDNGLIGKRKPTAITTNAKVSYIRDEFKLWNKLGLLETRSGKYFFPNVGLRFDWERITSVLTNAAIDR